MFASEPAHVLVKAKEDIPSGATVKIDNDGFASIGVSDFKNCTGKDVKAGQLFWAYEYSFDGDPE